MEHSFDTPLTATKVLGLIDSWEAMLVPMRGFEFSMMRLLLRLALTPGYVLNCTSEQLGQLCGLPPSTAIRLTRVLTGEQQLTFTVLGENHFQLSLTHKGKIQSLRLIETFETTTV